MKAGTGWLGARQVIEVTEEIINTAIRGDSSYCMIAEAIRRTLPEAQRISVDIASIRFSSFERGERYLHFTPGICQRALIAFDQGEDIEPFKFRIPKKPGQLIKITSRGKNREKNKKERPSKEGPKRLLDQKDVIEAKGGSELPVIVGGKAPPIAALSNRGRARVFGVRSAGRVDPQNPR